ncbi:checkpoint clamp complex protein Rad1 [Teratosphaeriaceae sp. CCFEE 6253]|nr:checkpoint clamp complex protein Rad1 [Teratosphaeriaceae sp. CCFEE 6253]
MASTPPQFTAVSSSTRQLLLLLRCISFTKKALVRISADGLRFSTEEGSTMEAFVFLDKALFTSYTFHPSPPPSSQDDPPGPPTFEINLDSLLETLNIFALSDPTSSKTHGPSDFAAYRLQRHAGINAFSNRALGVTGVCTLGYAGAGSALHIHLAEAGVSTTCALTTYEAAHTDEIPFARDRLALKAILRASSLLDAVAELSSLSPASVLVTATPAGTLSFSAAGALGSATVAFSTATSSETPVLETFHCPARVGAHYRFAALKAAQRAMGAAAKVSVRVDGEGVLSLQFLVEVDAGGAVGGGGGEGELEGEEGGSAGEESD